MRNIRRINLLITFSKTFCDFYNISENNFLCQNPFNRMMSTDKYEGLFRKYLHSCHNAARKILCNGEKFQIQTPCRFLRYKILRVLPQRDKEATKLYFTHYLCVIIICSIRVSTSLILIDSFGELAFCLSALFCLVSNSM